MKMKTWLGIAGALALAPLTAAADPLDDLIDTLPDSVTLKVRNPSPGNVAYFQATITGQTILDGIYPDSWCVDVGRTIRQNREYTAIPYSSYDPDLPEGLVDKPGNLDLVNWLINQNYVGKPSSDPCEGVYTYGDVQKAIWDLIDFSNSNAGVGPRDQCRIDQLVNAAEANGNDFVPGCDEKVAIVLAPVANNGNEQQTVIAQVTLIDIVTECENCLVIIDEDGVDNGLSSVETAAAACGVTPDALVNDDQPTEMDNPPLLWNDLVEAGQCDEPAGTEVLMPTGQRDDEAWFAPPQPWTYDTGDPDVGDGGMIDTVAYADDGCTGGDNSWTRYGLDYDAWIEQFADGTLAQFQLDKVCDVVPLRNQDLEQFVGKTCVAVVYDSDIGMNTEPLYANLQGGRLGQFTFEVTALEVAGPDSVLPETRSDTSLYPLWLQILAPEAPEVPFAAKVHNHEPDTCQIMQAKYENGNDRLVVYAESEFPGDDNTPPYAADGTPASDGDDLAYMTVTVDGADEGNNPGVSPFLLEQPMTYNESKNRYEFKLEPVGVNLDGRRLSVQSDEGCAYNAIIK